MKTVDKTTLYNFGQATTIAASSSSSPSSFVFRTTTGGARGRVKVAASRIPYASEMVPIAGEDICFHTYDPDAKFSESPPKALVIFFHGYIAHGTFPTSRMVADLLVANGYSVVAPDAPGHGLSTGIRGYLESGEKVTTFGVGAVDHAYKTYLGRIATEKVSHPDMPSPGLKVFLIGSSMGGNIALQTALRRSHVVSGVILMAPMLRITVINPITRFFIMKSAKIMPLTEAIPVLKCTHYRSPDVAKECERDMLKPHQQGDMVRLGTIKTLVELTDSLECQYEHVTTPCLVMVGDEDKQVNNKGAVELVKRATSKDMALKRYPALHGLMGEPAPLLNRIQDDMIRWLDERCNQDHFVESSL